MTDAEIIKALECCSTNNQKCYDCPLHTDCMMGVPSKNISRAALDLIQRQQKTINELPKGCDVDMELLKKAFRAEFEEKMELGIDDCINWADWLDSIAEEMKEGKYDDR